MIKSILNKVLVLAIFFGFVLGCKKDTDNPNPNPGPTPQGSTPLITGEFKPVLITNPSVPIGLFIKDDLNKEVITVSGKKDQSGKLTSINSIFIYNKDSRVALTVAISTDKLISEVEVLSTGGRRIIRFSGYDLAGKKVNVEIIDAVSGNVIKPKFEIPLSDDVITKINAVKASSMGGGRMAAADCSGLKETRLYQSIVECFVMSGKDWVLLCYAVSIATSPVGGVACAVAGGVYTYVKCSATTEELTKYEKECPDPPLPPLPDPDELLCLMNAPKFTKIEEREKYMDECKKKQEEEKKNENGGGGWGDPHLTTADGLYYDFQGFGEFIILKSTVDNFEVQGRHEAYMNREYASMTTALAIQTGEDIVSVHCNPLTLFVNNVKQNITSGTVALKNGASISIEGKKVNIISSSKDRIQIDAYGIYLNYAFFLKSDRKGKVEGLLGNFDGSKENDLKTKEGESVKNEFSGLYPKFSDSWRVNKNFLLHYESGKNTESYTRRDLPKPTPSYNETLFTAARNACIAAGVTGEPYLSNCTFDLLVTDNRDFINGYVDLVKDRPFCSFK